MTLSSSNLMRPLESKLVIEKITSVRTSPYDTYSVRTRNLEDLGSIKHHLKTNTTVYIANYESILSVPRLNYLAFYMQQLMISFEKASS